MAESVRNRVAPPPKPKELHVGVEQPKVNRIPEALGQHADEHRPWAIWDMDIRGRLRQPRRRARLRLSARCGWYPAASVFRRNSRLTVAGLR